MIIILDHPIMVLISDVIYKFSKHVIRKESEKAQPNKV